MRRLCPCPSLLMKHKRMMGFTSLFLTFHWSSLETVKVQGSKVKEAPSAFFGLLSLRLVCTSRESCGFSVWPHHLIYHPGSSGFGTVLMVTGDQTIPNKQDELYFSIIPAAVGKLHKGIKQKAACCWTSGLVAGTRMKKRNCWISSRFRLLSNSLWRAWVICALLCFDTNFHSKPYDPLALHLHL